MSRRHQSRREFMGLAGMAMAGVAGSDLLRTTAFGDTQSGNADPHHADLVVFNANVYTVDPQMPKAEAFAVKGSRFIFVGNSIEAKAFIGKKTQPSTQSR